MWVAMLLIGSLLTAPRSAAGQDKSGAKTGVDAKTAFAKIKTLVGTWGSKRSYEKAATSKEGDEHHGDESTVTYRLTGANSALVETQFPGTDHEMVSVYHLDGDDLRMTHYCAVGNQPRVKLDRVNSTPSHLIFVFDGGSNLDAAKDHHIHGVEITFEKDGRVTSAWDGYDGGKKAGTMVFALSRK
jgi:hypothetical protein